MWLFLLFPETRNLAKHSGYKIWEISGVDTAGLHCIWRVSLSLSCFSQSFLMAFGCILVHMCSGMRACSIITYFDSSPCNWMYCKVYLKCWGICKRSKWNWIYNSPSQVELMLDTAERERLGNPRQPEKPIIRLRVRNCSAWIALFLKVTVKSFKAKSCFLCKHIIYTFFCLYRQI